ncbi:hypothetical protein [Acinetobacter sp. PW68]|uniref:hypothetical protein n=1 Tax=Acinetobacter sp. PW68 TaxID=2865162 RepID=UPI001E2DB874|nr:hypothetical protein [Acinetobacter sp. PW68]MCD0188227.1 hypothetical protein [Acinetobacter sp. PW68]MCD0188259.1 hypothetical protein [Acinetobacter sp. PW68]
MPTHAQSAIIAKIKRLESERKQVMAHLHLLDDNIETLSKSLDILQSNQDDMTAFDTENFSYRPKLRVFVGKPKSYLLTIFKNEPTKVFTTLELTEKVMKLDNMDGLPQDKHIKAVKSVLYKLQKDGIVVKSKDNNSQIVWRWAN